MYWIRDWFSDWAKGYKMAARDMYVNILAKVADVMIQICKSNIGSEMLLFQSILELWMQAVNRIYGYHPGVLAPSVNTESTHFVNSYMKLINGIERFLIRFVTSSKLSPEFEVRIKKLISDLKSYTHLDLFLQFSKEQERIFDLPLRRYPVNKIVGKINKSRPISNITKDFSQTVHNTLKNGSIPLEYLSGFYR